MTWGLRYFDMCSSPPGGQRLPLNTTIHNPTRCSPYTPIQELAHFIVYPTGDAPVQRCHLTVWCSNLHVHTGVSRWVEYSMSPSRCLLLLGEGWEPSQDQGGRSNTELLCSFSPPFWGGQGVPGFPFLDPTRGRKLQWYIPGSEEATNNLLQGPK